jgi:hypothetical protein
VATVDGQGVFSSGTSLLGLPERGSSSLTTDPLRRQSDGRSLQAGFRLEGDLQPSWEWSLSGNVDLERELDVSEVEPSNPGTSVRPPRVRSRTSSRVLDLQSLVTGSLVSLPAGPVSTSFSADYQSNRLTSENSDLSSPRGLTLTRNLRSARVALVAPLFRREVVDIGIGNLTANLHAELQDVSDFGGLSGFGYGLNWAPLRGLSIKGSIAEEESAPSIRRLGAATISTPNVPVFDFVRQQTVEIDQIEGGNPNLRPEETRTMKLGASLRLPADAGLTLLIDYLHRRTKNDIRSFPTAIPEIENAFPERFARNGEGQLLRVDTRPVNLTRAVREELRWGVNFAKTLGSVLGARRGREVEGGDRNDPDEEPGGQSSRLRFSVYHSWQLQDRALIRAGLPELDFLRGSASGNGGGRPRHSVQAQAALYSNGFGLRINGRWQSATRVRSMLDAGGDGGDLIFADQYTWDARLFANVIEGKGLGRSLPWLSGTRFTVAVDNPFKSRPRVRDNQGMTPSAYQPVYLDPIGRTIQLTVRRRF